MSNRAFTNNLATWIVGQGLGLGAGSSLYVGRIRGEPTNAVLLKPTGGTDTSPALKDGFISLQVLTLSKSYDWAHNKAWDIYDLMNDRPPPWRAGASKILLSKAVQPPFFIGEDDRQRCRFSHNFRFKLGIEPE